MHIKNARNIFLSIPKAEKKATLFTQIAQSALKTKKKKRISFKFCPHKEFISHEQKEAHKKNAHKKCNCSWGQYFPTREEFLDHFYSVHPIPSRKRQMPSEMSVSFLPGTKSQRFSQFPEPVLLCCLSEEKDWERISTGDKDVFPRCKSLRMHGFFLGHNEIEMFLLDLVDDALKVTETAAIQRKAPTRTCSNLNHCWEEHHRK